MRETRSPPPVFRLGMTTSLGSFGFYHYLFILPIYDLISLVTAYDKMYDCTSVRRSQCSRTIFIPRF